jgi:hypothetical protein
MASNPATVSAERLAQAKGDLARVNENLQAAIRGLSGAAGRPGIQLHSLPLRETATLLGNVKRLGLTGPQLELTELLTSVQARSRKVELLFESAAAYYRGWLAASPVSDAGYTSSGTWACDAATVQFQMEA